MSAWPTIPFRQTGQWLSGGTPKRDEPAYWGGSLPWIGTKDLKSFDLDDSSEFVTEEGATAGSRVVDPGTVLFVTRGMSLAKEFRVGVVTRRLAFNQDIKGIVPREGLDGRFLAWFLRSREQYVLDQCDTATHGTKRLPLERIDAMPVPIPPLAEQRRIAAILDEADTLRRKRREALALLDELVPSVFLEMFGDPVSNPKGWEAVPLGEVLTDIETGWSPVCDGREASLREWGVLKLGAVTTGRFIEEHKALLPGVEPRPALEVRAGDVLFTRKNTADLVAAVTYVHRVRDRLMFPDLVFRLRPDTLRMEASFLASLLMMEEVRANVQSRAAGSSGSMPGISKAKLVEVVVPLPPLPLQKRFHTWLAGHEQHRGSVTAAIAAQDRLFEALLERAFPAGTGVDGAT